MLPLEILIIISSVLQPIYAASRQSFCKCVCGSNSTIIPLDGKPLDPPPRKHRSSSLLSLVSSSKLTSTASASSSSTSEPADDDYSLTGYARDAPLDERADTVLSTTIVDPLAHAQTAALDEFGTSTTLSSMTGTRTSSSATSTATEAEDESSPGNSTDTQLVSPQRAGTCNDCNRQFCLEHPDFDKMCGEAKEEEVFTTCFQRDSAKDQLVVYTFILVTVGLLGYAAVRPWIEKKYAAVRERRTYVSVSGGQGNG